MEDKRMSDRDKILEIKNLHFSYEKGREVLKGIDLSIGQGEKIAVLGNNGAGKSTLFLNMNGVREPSSGEIICCGERIEKKNRNILRKTVGIVFQDADTQLIAPTVRDEVSFGPMNMKFSKDEVRERCDRAISYMKLERFVDRPPHDLSGGEKKRVTMASILSMDTQIIIFDEPTASLDPVNTGLFEDKANELAKQGKTVIVSTHDIDFAYRFADRVIILADGEILADDRPEPVFCNGDMIKRAGLRKPVLLEVYEILQAEANTELVTPPKSIEELRNIFEMGSK